MNPFGKSPSPLLEGDRDNWICTKKSYKDLDELVQKNKNTVILGVEGSGKTTLLNMYFTEEFRQQSAQNGKLIFFADLSDTPQGTSLCSYLIRHLMQSARLYLAEALFKELETVLEDAVKANCSHKEQFVLACEHLYRRKHTLLLVMDRFEFFVCSDDIKQDQHDMLRSLLDKNIMRCVVATNYDLEESSLPPDIHGSMYLQKFQDKIIMSGFSREEAEEFISRRMAGDSSVVLNKGRIDYLYSLSGGIPLLFETAASHMYDRLERYGRVTVGELRADMLDAARPYISNWCKFFTPEYIDTVSSIGSSGLDDGVLKKFRISVTQDVQHAAATRLKERGFFVADRTENNCYSFNSLLLQQFASRNLLPMSGPQQPSTPAQKVYNIFISYKRTYLGEKTRDSEIAIALYDALSRVKGFVPFLDVKDLPNGIGASNFRATINSVLQSAQSFVFVCTQSDFLSTPWVKKEWTDYTGELLDGKKRDGSVYGVLEGVLKEDLPMDLRHSVSHFPFTDEAVNDLIKTIKTQLA